MPLSFSLSVSVNEADVNNCGRVWGFFGVCRIWDNCGGHNVFAKVTAGVIKDRKCARSKKFPWHLLATL